MSASRKILSPDYLEAVARRIPRLERFPAFRMDANEDTPLQAGAAERPGLEIVEIDFTELTDLS